MNETDPNAPYISLFEVDEATERELNRLADLIVERLVARGIKWPTIPDPVPYPNTAPIWDRPFPPYQPYYPPYPNVWCQTVPTDNDWQSYNGVGGAGVPFGS